MKFIEAFGTPYVVREHACIRFVQLHSSVPVNIILISFQFTISNIEFN